MKPIVLYVNAIKEQKRSELIQRLADLDSTMWSGTKSWTDEYDAIKKLFEEIYHRPAPLYISHEKLLEFFIKAT